MRNLFIVWMITLVVACHSQTDQTNTKDTTLTSKTTEQADIMPVDENIADISGCYMQVLKRDTFAVILKQNGNAVSGRLSLDNYEKDGSTGTVTGKMEAGVVKLVYRFASEGMNSIMEVNFKYKDNTLTRGIGEMTTQGDSAFFKDPSSIAYNGSVLTKMACEDLPAKYK